MQEKESPTRQWKEQEERAGGGLKHRVAKRFVVVSGMAAIGKKYISQLV